MVLVYDRGGCKHLYLINILKFKWTNLILQLNNWKCLITSQWDFARWRQCFRDSCLLMRYVGSWLWIQFSCLLLEREALSFYWRYFTWHTSVLTEDIRHGNLPTCTCFPEVTNELQWYMEVTWVHISLPATQHKNIHPRIPSVRWNTSTQSKINMLILICLFLFFFSYSQGETEALHGRPFPWVSPRIWPKLTNTLTGPRCHFYLTNVPLYTDTSSTFLLKTLSP